MGINDMQEFKRRVEDLEKNHDVLTTDTQKLTETVDKLYNDVMQLQKGFPGDDPGSHRRYHDLLIADIEAKKRLRQAIVEKTISGLVWSAIVGFALLMWRGFGVIITKGF